MKAKAVQIMVLVVMLASIGCGSKATPPIPHKEERVGVVQTKIFDSVTSKSSLPELENEVNEWLSANHEKVEITEIKQTQGDYSRMVITIFYRKIEK